MASNEYEKTKVRSAGLEDQASEKDYLGFTPYVDAIFNFLENDRTKPPFTLSIEGDWGSGKSSFMLQLQTKLKNKEAIVIKFNAWRHDKMESMWAAFALTFIKQLSKQRFFLLRPILNLIVLFRRYDWKNGLLELLLKVAMIGLYISLGITFFNIGGLSAIKDFLFVDEGKIENLDFVKIFSSLGFMGLVLAGIFFARKAGDVLGNPLAIDLTKYINKPDYVGNTSFIESFHSDFDKAVRVLAFKKKKVYVFIDDLDRAEIPKAAELMQGLNMMISDSPKIIFIIGMDREKVAAGIAAKYEPLLKYLGYSEQSNVNDALLFGSNYLQKFIQLSFRIPMPTAKDIKAFINSINDSQTQPDTKNGPSEQVHSIMLEDGEDALAMKATIEAVAPFFENNPRLLKQFTNAFRLKCHIAFNTGLFLSMDEGAPITIQQVGKFVAMIMLWPRIIDALFQNPNLVTEILTDPSSGETFSKESDSWRLRADLVKLLECCPDNTYEFEYDMTNVNFKRLIETSPAIIVSENARIQVDTGDSEADYGVDERNSEKQSPTGSTTTTTTTFTEAK